MKVLEAIEEISLLIKIAPFGEYTRGNMLAAALLSSSFSSVGLSTINR
jgi:hypothetical protein